MKRRSIVISLVLAALGVVSIQGPNGVQRASALVYTNSTLMTLPAGPSTGAVTGAPATLYPSNITVAGHPGTITRLEVMINIFAHALPDDIDMLLVGPTGAKMVIWSDVGGSTTVAGKLIRLGDAGSGLLPDAGPLVNGFFQPTNVGTGDAFPAPAPATAPSQPAPAGTATFASTFNGTSPNGTWSLYIVDDLTANTGEIAGGWSLDITTNSAPVWNTIPGAALDIASGGANTFALGTTAAPGGRLIYQYVGGASVWQNIAGAAEVIAVSSGGQLWAAQNAAQGNTIYVLTGSGWVNIPGAATDLAASGEIYALGTQAVTGGFLIYHSVGGAVVWQNIPGAAAQIALAVDNQLWARQTNNDIYRYDPVGGTWTSIPGKAVKLAAGNGLVYALGTTPIPGGFPIYKYVGGAAVWQFVSGGAAVDLGVEANGAVWAIGDASTGNRISRCITC